MLTREESQMLISVRAGTPVGELMRRYWLPIAMSAQLEADGDPLRTKLLGQRFVLFRDTAGKVGVLDEHCMHRSASLALGRNEEGGLRCIYHGWKFATDGTILETPNHADCRLRERKKAPAYPVREQSGLVWTYIGPKELEPPFRAFAYEAVPDSHRTVFRVNMAANWLPVWEGGVDSSHVGILHTNMVHRDRASQTAAWTDLAPRLEVEDTEYGFKYAAIRSFELNGEMREHVRVVPAMLPCHRLIPGKEYDIFVADVPMDDFETATYSIVFSHECPIDREYWSAWFGFESPLYDPKSCWFTIDSESLGQDRSRMGESWTGYDGVELEDFAIAVSLGPDWDRTKETLVTSDMAVARLRRRLLEALRHFQSGQPPPGIAADLSQLLPCDTDLGPREDWRDLAARRALICAPPRDGRKEAQLQR